MSACKCSDCTKCPYDYCIDEDKDNSEGAVVLYREYTNGYYASHRDKINSQAKARYRYKREHGICVKCKEKAVDGGSYCLKHKLYTQSHNRASYLQRRG